MEINIQIYIIIVNDKMTQKLFFKKNKLFKLMSHSNIKLINKMIEMSVPRINFQHSEAKICHSNFIVNINCIIRMFSSLSTPYYVDIKMPKNMFIIRYHQSFLHYHVNKHDH